MTQLLRPTVLLSAAALFAFSPAGDSVDFHPADGSDAAKSFTLNGSFEVGDLSVTVDGMDMSQQIPLDQAKLGFDLALAIVDHYVKTADGKPTELHRDYVSSKSSADMGAENKSTDNPFKLDGKTVVFKWNEEKQDYERTFKDGEGDNDALQSAGIDLDFRSLLPGKSIAEGDKWQVEPKALGTALFFGVDFDHLPEMEGGGEEVTMLKEKILPELEKMFAEFKAECTYSGMREVDGVQVAAIKLDVNSDSSLDLSSLLLDLMESQMEGQEVQVEYDIKTATLGAKIKGAGELLLDAKAGRVHGFAMQADVEFNVEIDVSVDAEGQSHSAELSAEMLGNAEWAMGKN